MRQNLREAATHYGSAFAAVHTCKTAICHAWEVTAVYLQIMLHDLSHSQ